MVALNSTSSTPPPMSLNIPQLHTPTRSAVRDPQRPHLPTSIPNALILPPHPVFVPTHLLSTSLLVLVFMLPALYPFRLITAVTDISCPFPMCRSIYVHAPEVYICFPRVPTYASPSLPSYLFTMARRPKISLSCPFYPTTPFHPCTYSTSPLYVFLPSLISKDIVITGGLLHADVPIPLSILGQTCAPISSNLSLSTAD